MSNVSLVATVIGPDRPGLVERLAATAAASGANWIESRMAHLAGQFAGIMRWEVPQEQAAGLRQALAALEAEGLQLILQSDAGGEQPTAGQMQLLELVGHDRPGIVREVTAVLAKQGANVEELTTTRAPATNTGQPLFNATILLQLPPEGSQEQLRAALEEVAADMMVDIQLDQRQLDQC